MVAAKITELAGTCKRGHSRAEHGYRNNKGRTECRTCVNALKRAKHKPKSLPATCPKGHLKSQHIRIDKQGKRFCYACKRLREHSYTQARREAREKAKAEALATCKAGHLKSEHTRYDKTAKGMRCIECKRLASLKSYHKRKQAREAREGEGHNWIHKWDWDSERELLMTID